MYLIQLRPLPRRHRSRCQLLGSFASCKTRVPVPPHALRLQRQNGFVSHFPLQVRHSSMEECHAAAGASFALEPQHALFYFATPDTSNLFNADADFLQNVPQAPRRHEILHGGQRANHRHISRTPLNSLFLQVGRVCDYLGQSFAPHFTPSYKPWDQRVCLLPNGDLMQVLALTSRVFMKRLDWKYCRPSSRARRMLSQTALQVGQSSVRCGAAQAAAANVPVSQA